MKKNKTAIIVGIVALGIGFGVGYMVGKKKATVNLDVDLGGIGND
jgi:hypothetical protein